MCLAVVARPSGATEEEEEEEEGVAGGGGAVPWRKVHAQLHQNGISRCINFRNARLKRPGTAK